VIIRREDHFLHSEEHGDPAKPPLLLIMGLTVSSRAWEKLPSLLQDDFHVITFDNRGSGRSSRTGFAYRMADLADDAAAVLDAHGIGQAAVFGISMGGMVALELSLRHPQRVRRLALGCTFAGFRTAHRAPIRHLLQLISDRLRFGRDESVARILFSKGFSARNPGRCAQWLRDSDQTSLRCALAQLAAIARHHTLPRLPRIRAPTLIITGDADRLVPERNSHVLAGTIRGAKLLVLRGAGHVFPLERESETVDALRAHFSEGAPRVRAD
jgi:pimeloyl-ACP methyl ester carboxylesterase